MLLEREPQLAVLRTLLREAVGGAGRFALVSGEAGVGKTALVAELVSTLAGDAPPGLRVRRGACDDLTTPAPLGPVMEALPELESVVDEVAPRHVVLRSARSAMAQSPTLLVVEDVHWADEATLDLLRFVGRRLEGLPLLVVATYRDDLAADHPLSLLLGELTGPGVVRVPVPPLSASGVQVLVDRAGSTVDAGELHEATGGNAFYVTEVLANPAEHDGPPATVRDAVLARVARLGPQARGVLDAAAVLGQPATLALLAEVSGCPPRAVDECVAAGLLVARAPGWDFRHALARAAVASTLAPARAAELHASALAALVAGGVTDDRRLAFHAAACGDTATVDRHAPRAAARAARLGAHREALEMLRLSLSAHPQRDATQARLWADLSYECYLTGRLDEARDARLEVLELSTSPLETGSTLRWLSRLSWFVAAKADADAYAERAVATLEPLGPGVELAMAYSNVAQLRMLEGDAAGAAAWGQRALALARELGDRETQSHALNNIGAALVLHDPATGLAHLHQALDLALAADAHEHVARAYTNLASTLVVLRRLPEAQAELRAGLNYCAERDLDAWQHYMTAWRAVALLEGGRYAEGREVAERLLAQPLAAPVARIPALCVVARLALRTEQGDHAADEALAQARALAQGSREAQRLVPVAATAAEAAWLRGGRDVPDVLHEAWEVALRRPQRWELGELAWWRIALGVDGAVDDARELELAEPFRLMAEGAWKDAAGAWEELGCPWWQAVSLSRDPELASAQRGLALLDGLPAPAVRAAVERDRRVAGLPVPRGPRGVARSNDAGLTARELEVLALVAEGLSDADIARGLVLSPKTVGHHVSAVLAKLGEPSRSRAAAAARRRGLVPDDQPDHQPDDLERRGPQR